MPLAFQDALIELMVATASADVDISELELDRIGTLVGRLPVFSGYGHEGVAIAANRCADRINGPDGLDGALDEIIAVIPQRLHDTAYALAVEVAVVDLDLPQEQLRLLEMIRDRLTIDRLLTAAIEAAARARMRRA